MSCEYSTRWEQSTKETGASIYVQIERPTLEHLAPKENVFVYGHIWKLPWLLIALQLLVALLGHSMQGRGENVFVFPSFIGQSSFVRGVNLILREARPSRPLSWEHPRRRLVICIGHSSLVMRLTGSPPGLVVTPSQARKHCRCSPVTHRRHPACHWLRSFYCISWLRPRQITTYALVHYRCFMAAEWVVFFCGPTLHTTGYQFTHGVEIRCLITLVR